ncbi:MAG TPA: hypothetical protein PKY70_15225 [Nakamurella multipartita]|nr:hypothetical protein [Nakamurella multipartita]
MATATKAAQSGAEKAENAVAQVTETISATVSKATAVANDLVTKTTDAFAPVVKSAEEKTQELTAAFAEEVKKAEAKGQELTEQFAAEVKKAEAKAQELSENLTEEYKKAEAKAKEYAEAFAAEVKKVVVISVDTYQEAVKRYLELTVDFVDSFKNDAVSDLTKKNAAAITELVDASVAQTKDLLK